MAYIQKRPSGTRHQTTLSSDTTFRLGQGSPTEFRVPDAAYDTNNSGHNQRGGVPEQYKDDPSDVYGVHPRQQFARDQDMGRASFAPPKSTGDLRIWRHDERGNMWTKGSRARVVGRFCCCTLMMAFFLIVSIVLALALWARPPDITFTGVQLPTSSSGVTVQQNSLDIDLQLGISVRNPNFFGATFKSITAKAFYPPLTAQVGGGALYDIVFPANSNTQFNFPFNITYSTSIDPQHILIQDLVNKCGIISGSTKEPLTVKYEISLQVRILVVNIPPSFSGSATFDCPVTRDDLLQMGGEALLQSLGAS